ncbi:hypothetical protein B0H13DRAFT_2262755 [Mycena leptocephala]|nr:hypothetical protein B0H13DRAFT_2262755 [Mycena leptocephala]
MAIRNHWMKSKQKPIQSRRPTPSLSWSFHPSRNRKFMWFISIRNHRMKSKYKPSNTETNTKSELEVSSIEEQEIYAVHIHKKSSDEVEAETYTIAEANTKSELEVDSSVAELEIYFFEKSTDGENNDLKMMTADTTPVSVSRWMQ